MATRQPMEYNMIEIPKRRLQVDIQSILTEKIVKEELEAFEKKLRPIVEAETKKIVIDRIESLRDAMRMRDEVKVYVEFKGDDDR